MKTSRLTSTGATEERGSDHEERGVSKEDNPGGPDIYGEATGDTQPDLTIIKDPSRTSEMSESFDPYNSGTFKVLKK